MLVFTVNMKAPSEHRSSLVLHAHNEAIRINLWDLDYASPNRLHVWCQSGAIGMQPPGPLNSNPRCHLSSREEGC